MLRKVLTGSPNLNSSVLVRLQTRQCPNLQTALKNLIKGVIVEHSGVDIYNDVLAKHKRLLPLNFDLELLEQFVSDHSISQVLVSLSDVETFDSHVTNDLIHTLHLWQRRIPFALMLGITSTRELFEHRISKSCLKYMEARTFNFAPWSDLTSDLLREAQEFNEKSLQAFLGSGIMSILSDINKVQAKSAQSLRSILQYLYMSHFFANPVAILADMEAMGLGDEDQKHLAQLVRSTESFRVFCENLLAEKDKMSNAKVRNLLGDDKALLQEVKERVQEGQNAYDASRRVICGFADLCYVLLREDSSCQKSKLEYEAQLFRALDDLRDTEVYDEVARRVQALTPPALLQALGRLKAQTVAILDLGKAIEALQGQLQRELILDGNAKDETSASLAKTNGNSWTASISSPPKRKSKSSKTTTPGSKASKDDATADCSAKAQLLTSVQHKLRMSSLDTSCLLLHEAYIVSARSTRFKPSFEPRPRAAVERALLRPSDYLGWHQGQEGGDTDDSDAGGEHESSRRPPSTMPAASILFTLLQEAPTIINVRDLFDAFRSRLEPAQETNGTTHDQDEEAELKATMTQFYRALAELKLMGLVKPSTGTQVKRIAKGRNTKSGTHDIDFVAKTSWAGL